MNFTTPTDRQRRQGVTDDIIQQVRDAVREELAGTGESFTVKVHEEIEEIVMSHTQQVVDALSYDEMQSEGALLSHIADARRDTQRLIRERRLPSKQ